MAFYVENHGKNFVAFDLKLGGRRGNDPTRGTTDVDTPLQALTVKRSTP